MDDSTARMFRLVLVLLMVFTEKLHEAINAPPNPPHHINHRHSWLAMSGRRCCYSTAIQPVAAARVKI